MNCDNCEDPKNSLIVAVTDGCLLRCENFIILNWHPFADTLHPRKSNDWLAKSSPMHEHDGSVGYQYRPSTDAFSQVEEIIPAKISLVSQSEPCQTDLRYRWWPTTRSVVYLELLALNIQLSRLEYKWFAQTIVQMLCNATTTLRVITVPVFTHFSCFSIYQWLCGLVYKRVLTLVSYYSDQPQVITMRIKEARIIMSELSAS